MHRGKYVLPLVVCPSDDLKEMASRLEAASALFRELCPAGAQVTDVYGMRERGKYKCSWTVRYVRLDGYDHIAKADLVRLIDNGHPNNTSIVEKIKLFPPALQVTYSINCDCPCSPNAGKFFWNEDMSCQPKSDPDPGDQKKTSSDIDLESFKDDQDIYHV